MQINRMLKKKKTTQKLEKKGVKHCTTTVAVAFKTFCSNSCGSMPATKFIWENFFQNVAQWDKPQNLLIFF